MSDLKLKPTAGDPSANPGPLSSEQRLALVRAFQAQALDRANPLLANLGILSADLMGFSHLLAASVQTNLEQLPSSAQGRKDLFQNAELFLKFVRQIDRLAQIERQLEKPSRED